MTFKLGSTSSESRDSELSAFKSEKNYQMLIMNFILYTVSYLTQESVKNLTLNSICLSFKVVSFEAY